jgi:hypothetical protein
MKMTPSSRSRLFLIAATAALLCAPLLVGDRQRVQAQSQTLWVADHEEPGEMDWYSPGGLNFGGGENNGGCTSTPPLAGWGNTTFLAWDDDPATPVPGPPPAGGNFGLLMTVAAPCGNGLSAGTRLFRWQEPRQHPDLYYKVWYYVPETYSLIGDPAWSFWNIWIWKSKSDAQPQGDTFYQINVYNRPITNNMYLTLYNWQCAALGRHCEGSGATPPRVPGTEAIDVPVNQWFSIEALYRSRGDGTGEVKVWQDGELLWDVTNVVTMYPGGWTEWAVSNSSTGLQPQPAHILIDTAEIRTP